MPEDVIKELIEPTEPTEPVVEPAIEDVFIEATPEEKLKLIIAEREAELSVLTEQEKIDYLIAERLNEIDAINAEREREERLMAKMDAIKTHNEETLRLLEVLRVQRYKERLELEDSFR
jgi:hypothetical protein